MLMLYIANVCFANTSEIDTIKTDKKSDSILVENAFDTISKVKDLEVSERTIPEKPKFDKIYLLNGDVLIVILKTINASEIQFKYPYNIVVNHIKREEVKKIEHSYGKIEIINNKAIAQEKEETWKDVDRKSVV